MKKIYTLIAFAAAAFTANAQVGVEKPDSAITGAYYANDVYYSFKNGTVKTQPNNDWHLAFATSSFDVAIFINDLNSSNPADQQVVTLYPYPNADSSGWGTFDTAGCATWRKLENSDTNWAYGAFNRDGLGDFDYSWGVYNPGNHVISGDSLYLLVITTNNVKTYKKLHIQNKTLGTWNFRHANVDGTDEVYATINGTAYNTKNFVYYDVRNNTTVDREPAKGTWDILFSRFREFSTIYNSIQNVAGILQNVDVEVAVIKNTDAANADYTTLDESDYSYYRSFIGSEWKDVNLNLNPPALEPLDSVTFFVKTRDNEIYKFYVDSVTGSSSGKNFFNKTLVYEDVPNAVRPSENVSIFTVYPNPATDKVEVLLETVNPAGNVTITVTDLNGRTYSENTINSNATFNAYAVNVNQLAPGMYVLQVKAGLDIVSKKFIKQ